MKYQHECFVQPDGTSLLFNWAAGFRPLAAEMQRGHFIHQTACKQLYASGSKFNGQGLESGFVAHSAIWLDIPP